MKTASAIESTDRMDDDLRPEYDFDFTEAKPNRFAARAADGLLVVVLDEDLAKFFKTPEAVKTALRNLVTSKPKSRTRKPTPRPQKD